MTVRAWVTISAVVLVALAIAAAVRILSPLPAPSLIATAGGVRLDGVVVASCWPQRSGELRCRDGSPDLDEDPDADVPSSGRFRVIADYPVRPEEGSLRVVERSSGDVVVRDGLDESTRYDLAAGSYVLEVEARWSADAFVRSVFAFDVVS